jgi:uncharacterized membrane protein
VTNLPPPPSWSPPPSGGGGAGAPSAGVALSYGWKKFQQNAGPIIGVILIQLVVQGALSVLGRIAVHSLIGSLLFNVLSIIVGAIVGIGIYQMALMITAGQPADIGRAFQFDRWGEWIIFSFVFGLMVGLGLLLCVIPGLLALAFFGLAPFYFIDGHMSLGEALTASRTAVTSRGLAFPILLSIIVGALGFIACIVGLIVTIPVAYIAVAYLYRYATGQPVSA